MIPEHLIATYGYAALFLGTIIEGESFLIAAACLAGYGYMDVPLIYGVAVAGAVTGDNFFFYAGRCRGRRVLQKNPSWKVHVEKLFVRTTRYHTLLALMLRFLYGFRMLLPFAMGLGGFQAKRFWTLDLISAVTWAAVVSVIGLGFGNIFQAATGETGKQWVRWPLAPAWWEAVWPMGCEWFLKRHSTGFAMHRPTGKVQTIVRI